MYPLPIPPPLDVPLEYLKNGTLLVKKVVLEHIKCRRFSLLVTISWIGFEHDLCAVTCAQLREKQQCINSIEIGSCNLLVSVRRSI